MKLPYFDIMDLDPQFLPDGTMRVFVRENLSNENKWNHIFNRMYILNSDWKKWVKK